jgi:hypothetical protein
MSRASAVHSSFDPAEFAGSSLQDDASDEVFRAFLFGGERVR